MIIIMKLIKKKTTKKEGSFFVATFYYSLQQSSDVHDLPKKKKTLPWIQGYFFAFSHDLLIVVGLVSGIFIYLIFSITVK